MLNKLQAITFRMHVRIVYVLYSLKHHMTNMIDKKKCINVNKK